MLLDFTEPNDSQLSTHFSCTLIQFLKICTDAFVLSVIHI